MNLQTTFLLIVVAVAMGIVAYINPFKADEDAAEDSPWFYRLAEEDITRLEVVYQGEKAAFTKEDGREIWEFVDPVGIPPRHFRWAGVTLIFSGPITRRDLSVWAPTIEDPAQYGLDNPITVVDVSLTAGRNLRFRLGDMTPDGGHNYAQVVGFPQLYIVAAGWAEVVNRLVTDPPFPRWYLGRKPELIVELNVIEGDQDALQAPAKISFKRVKQTEDWTVTDRANDKVNVPVDPEKWQKIIPLLSGPPGVHVLVPRVDDLDYTPWGLTDQVYSVELRFRGESERGTHFVDGDMYTIGDRTPDGRAYYGRLETQQFSAPILRLDAEWVDTILELLEDVPLGQEEDAPESESG